MMSYLKKIRCVETNDNKEILKNMENTQAN